MSRITLSGNASGTGNFTLASPNSNTDRTLTLPDATGTVATAESTLAQFNASGSAPVFACRAWVNFNGSGTVAIRASGNVSSITDNGTGDYTLNFTNALEDANYAPVSMGRRDSATQDSVISIHVSTLPTTTALRIGCTNGNGTFEDFGFVCVAVFR